MFFFFPFLPSPFGCVYTTIDRVFPCLLCTPSQPIRRPLIYKELANNTGGCGYCRFLAGSELMSYFRYYNVDLAWPLS